MSVVIPEGPKRLIYHGKWNDQKLIERDLKTCGGDYASRAEAAMEDFKEGVTSGIRRFQYSSGAFIIPFSKTRTIVQHVEDDLYDVIHVYVIKSEDLPTKDRKIIEDRIDELKRERNKAIEAANKKGLVK